MKKILLIILCTASLSPFAYAQVLTVNGSVKDEAGNTVPLALVQDKGDKTATRTDSLGKFTLKTNPNSTLFISSSGYQPKVVDIKGRNDLLVILKNDDGTPTPTPQVPSAFNGYTANNGTSGGLLYGNGGVGGLFPTFHPTEETQGSRYLFSDWVTGYVVGSQDSVFKNPNYGFNYDKIGGGLLLTQDKRSAIEIDPSKIKSFTLYDNLNQPRTFEYVPDINKKRFPQLIAGGGKYKIYKLTTTKFVKNNFHSDGMTSTGNNYDEYVDEYTYYVLNVQSKQLQELSLKKKSIKAVFAGEGKKLDSFFDAYSAGNINDAYLKSLGDYMNQ
ncbi:MAG: hypothetical protein JWR12_1724 [Mucilaginibacter sp.]|jgi:hypothetical protein|nr:hypothetical protein [Mucilaginibacter sp.]